MRRPLRLPRLRRNGRAAASTAQAPPAYAKDHGACIDRPVELVPGFQSRVADGK